MNHFTVHFILLASLPQVRPSCPYKSRDCEQTRPQLLGGIPFVRWSGPWQLDFAYWRWDAFQCIPYQHFIKRISLTERVIDIDGCLTMLTLCQFVSMQIPFFSRPLSVSVLITFYRPLFVCSLYIHLTVASGRFFNCFGARIVTSGPRRKKDGGALHLDSFPRWRWSFSLPPSPPPPPPLPLATSLDLRWE